MAKSKKKPVKKIKNKAPQKRVPIMGNMASGVMGQN